MHDIGFIVLVCCALKVLAQDPSVYGLFAEQKVRPTSRATNLVYSKCFQGLDMITCVPTLPKDPTELSYTLDYYKDLGSITGTNFCLACCGSAPNHIDTWELTCPLKAPDVNRVNLYGNELRLARNKSPDDREIISCDLPRTACTRQMTTNSTEELLICDPLLKTTRLSEIKITIWVKQYNANFVYWNGVSKCEIEAVETDQALIAGETYNFKETIVMIHEPVPIIEQPRDYIKIGVIVIGVLFATYLGLYFCRRKHCVYCQQKLVINFTLCYKCYLLGVELPDPVLMQALEEKSLQLQGTLPERFPGSRALVACIRGWYKYVCKCGRDTRYKVTKILPVSVEVASPQNIATAAEYRQLPTPNLAHGNSRTSTPGSVMLTSPRGSVGGTSSSVVSPPRRQSISAAGTRTGEEMKDDQTVGGNYSIANMSTAGGLSVNTKTTSKGTKSILKGGTGGGSGGLSTQSTINTTRSKTGPGTVGGSAATGTGAGAPTGLDKNGKKIKHRNPNILDYPDDIIYKAVQHPGYPAKATSP